MSRREKLSLELSNNGKINIKVPGVSDEVELTTDLVTIEKRTRIDHVRTYTPNVIEPSFVSLQPGRSHSQKITLSNSTQGLGRIFYALCEHVYWTREGEGNESRAVLSFPPTLAPIPVAVLPLSSNADLNAKVRKLSALLRKQKIHHVVDNSGVSIGRRYSRQDQVGTAFGITVDFESLQNDTYTLRERDSTNQVRGTEEEIVKALVAIVGGEETWEDVAKRLPKFEAQEVAEDN